MAENTEKGIEITHLPGVDALVVKKPEDSRVFVTTDDSIVISMGYYVSILNFLVQKGILSHRVLEGILEEYNTNL